MDDVKSDSQSFPARIHVLIARDAPYGLVIRRGPSKQVCFVGWDRTNDSFTLGQWLKGRIYERRSDISSDGAHAIYFAGDGVKWWTAISRAPYLKAVGLWIQDHAWSGGGLFLDDSSFWFNESFDVTTEMFPGNLHRVEKPSGMGECPQVYYPRLERDGWQWIADEKRRGGSVTIFEKPVAVGWTLRKVCHSSTQTPKGKGCYWDEHELHRNGQTRSLPDWEWAEFVDGRVVWAEHGKLCAATLTWSGLEEETLLHDFNSMKFEHRIAPY